MRVKDLYGYLESRGFLYQSTNNKLLKDKLNNDSVVFYYGIDPTATSLHIGHLVGLRLFKILQENGHKGILVIGGATASVGDPSGKNDIRKTLTSEQIFDNLNRITNLSKKFINTEGDNKALIYDNSEWIKDKKYVNFLQDVGRHFSVNQMLASDAYANRIKNGGLTFLEMGYMLMQAYDFVHLSREHDCELQIGGSDQWGNIVAGTMLKRKMDFAEGLKTKEVVGLTFPLLTNKDGTKMGKTEKGTLWIEEKLVTAYEFYQYFYNIDDADVEKLLKIFTDLPEKDIKIKLRTNIIDAKRLMAKEITALIHGKHAAESAVRAALQVFENKETLDSSSIPGLNIKRDKLSKGVNLVDVILDAKLSKSKGEARRIINQGGIYLNEIRIENKDKLLKLKDFKKDTAILRKGKKQHVKLNIG